MYIPGLNCALCAFFWLNEETKNKKKTKGNFQLGLPLGSPSNKIQDIEKGEGK